MRNLRVDIIFSIVLLLNIQVLLYQSEHVHAQSCEHENSVWHPPVNGACTYGHEHGDAPPSWAQIGFDHDGGFHGSTSSIENTTKHTSMKGTLATFKDRSGGTQEVYLRTHFASNMLERSSRYHSYEMYMKDSQGGISHWQGWSNAGSPDPVAGQRRSKTLADNGVRPLILVVDEAAFGANLKCEQWYTFTSIQGWGPDIGSTICDSTTIYFPTELQYTEYPDIINFYFGTCQFGAGLCKGNDRELELAWYGPDSIAAPNRGNPPKNVKFWATQFGEIVNGQSDPKCAGTTTRFGIPYPNVCLEQYIASTAKTIENPNNRFRKTYNIAGVQIPN